MPVTAPPSPPESITPRTPAACLVDANRTLAMNPTIPMVEMARACGAFTKALIPVLQSPPRPVERTDANRAAAKTAQETAVETAVLVERPVFSPAKAARPGDASSKGTASSQKLVDLFNGPT